MNHRIIISLGGSIMSPRPGYLDINFLKKFRQIVLKHIVAKKRQAIIVTGGGQLNKQYNQAVKKVIQPKPIELDRLGIAATRFHAELIRIIFGEFAHPEVLINPTRRIKAKQPIICACGWKPGCSTDKDAVLLASTFGCSEIINLTNIDFVYTKDPRKFPEAKRVLETTWSKYLKMIPSRWSPRLNTPFDPIASRLAQKNRLNVAIINGRKLGQFIRHLADQPFRGTLIKRDK
ncbi:MAG: UMP kinase [Patescibacteria group bacterium]|nr:UMP kinase [Patescibacteria group bacterium]